MQPKSLLFSAAVIFEFVLPSQSMGQYVNSTAFCASISHNRCIGAFADGQQVSITELRKISGHPSIFFFASVNAPSLTPFVFNMIRQGVCYGNELSASHRKVAESPGALKTFWAYIQSGRAADDLLRMFDVTRANGEIGAKVQNGAVSLDAKLNPVMVPNSNNFGIHDYRNVLCPGLIQANVTDAEGNIVPGDNDIKKISIVR